MKKTQGYRVAKGYLSERQGVAEVWGEAILPRGTPPVLVQKPRITFMRWEPKQLQAFLCG